MPLMKSIGPFEHIVLEAVAGRGNLWDPSELNHIAGTLRRRELELEETDPIDNRSAVPLPRLIYCGLEILATLAPGSRNFGARSVVGDRLAANS